MIFFTVLIAKRPEGGLHYENSPQQCHHFINIKAKLLWSLADSKFSVAKRGRRGGREIRHSYFTRAHCACFSLHTAMTKWYCNGTAKETSMARLASAIV
jgi:hypothetical protein